MKIEDVLVPIDFSPSSVNAVAYAADLMAARNILQTAYGFDGENVQNW